MFWKLLLLSSLLYLDVSCAASALQSNALFTCNNGNSIPIEKFCDGNQDCDGSDENMTSLLPHNKSKTTISCETFPNLTCEIDVGYLCNNSVTCEGFDPCDAGCHTHYRCKNNTCVERTTICNGNKCDGCEEEDGWETGIGFQCIKNGMSCRIPQQLLYDDVQDCDEEDDMCFSTAVEAFQLNSASLLLFNQSRCFICLDRSMIVPRRKVCDDVIDCSDLSDECLCEGEEPEICQRVAGLTTCPIGNGKECKVGQVVCKDGGCIERTSVCDSNVDCTGYEDERYSYCKGTLPCRYGKQMDAHQACRCNATCGTTIGVICNGVGDCPDPIDDEIEVEIEKKDKRFPFDDECNAQCNASISSSICSDSRGSNTEEALRFQCDAHHEQNGTNITSQIEVFPSQVCDGIAHCNVESEDEIDCPGRFSCSSKGRVSIVTSQKCDGIYDCDDESDESNVTCPERFLCPYRNNERISIDRRFVCDGHINCDDQADEVNCTDDGRFYCENKVPLFVTKRQKFDGVADCTDLSDECPLNSRDENIFSSRYELIANPILRAAVWIMGLIALLGNMVVIIGELKNLYKTMGTSEPAPLRTNRMLVLNLAIADFFMGLYLIALGVSGATFSGAFCASKWKWVSSTTCIALGVIVTISTETSVITMVVLTSFRLYAAVRPFRASYSPKPATVVFLIVLAWCSAMMVAFIPLSTQMQYIFTDEVLCDDNPYFKRVAVSFGAVQEWMKKLLVFDPTSGGYNSAAVSQISSATTWEDLQNIMESLNTSQTVNISGYLGYYSANSVCVPRLFVTTNDSAWKFSLTVSIFNFLSFIFVAVAYVAIIKHTSRRGSSGGGKRKVDQQSLGNVFPITEAMEGKVFRLVATDFFCWVPLSILVFIHFGGHTLSDVSYVVSAIILLPINSALNPILYSSFLGRSYDKIKRFLSKGKPKSPSLRQPSRNNTAITGISDTIL